MTKSGPEVGEKAKSDNEFLAMPGAEILLKALEDENVEVIFGYPGGAVLPIYDALFKNNKITIHMYRFMPYSPDENRVNNRSSSPSAFVCRGTGWSSGVCAGVSGPP